MTRESLVTSTLVELADSLVEDFDVVELLTLLVDRCVAMLDVSAAGLMLATPGEGLRVMASSSDAMRLLELFEVQSQEGPCFDCYDTGAAVSSNDLPVSGEQWPLFTPRALAAGFHSVHALPMRLRGNVIGALNLFRFARGAMQEADIMVGQALADVATIAILQQRASAEAQLINSQLDLALKSRVVVEQAKGIVSQQANLNMEQAFLRLRNHARNHNLRLADVGRSIVDRTLVAESLDVLPRGDELNQA